VTGTSITVHVNDDVLDAPAHITLRGILRELDIDPRGTAVAINGELTPKSQWDEHHLADGDRIEVLTVAQGG
jgi:sulfur carrier protein